MSFICHIHNYTEYNEEWNVFSAFNPSKCTHLEQWAADCAAPGEQSWTSFRSRDSNPQPWVTSGFKSNALSIRPTTAKCLCFSVKRYERYHQLQDTIPQHSGESIPGRRFECLLLTPHPPWTPLHTTIHTSSNPPLPHNYNSNQRRRCVPGLQEEQKKESTRTRQFVTSLPKNLCWSAAPPSSHRSSTDHWSCAKSPHASNAPPSTPSLRNPKLLDLMTTDLWP